MILEIMYLMMGVTIGIIVRYEYEIKAKKKKAEQRLMYMKSTASKPDMKQYDDLLTSIRAINDSLSSMHDYKQHKKEVR
jgi:hypothetical protein